MLRCAIYARFSTDRQNPLSASDQIRICHERIAREGWSVAGEYRDHAISGADINRPGMSDLLENLAAGSFDIVVAEDLDRIARDLADQATIFKRICFAGARLFTLIDGFVDEMHIGFKGTMNAIELKKTVAKIRRGQQGAVARGRVPGGLTYGYDVVRELRPDGTLEVGLRRINEQQAEVIRRIASEYISGRGVKSICHGLNADNIPGPAGGLWYTSAISGSASRGMGILHNPIYVGRLVWGRVRMFRDPDSRKRISRVTAADDRKETFLPELQIIDDQSWATMRVMLAERADMAPAYRHSPKHLLSGLVVCGSCGGSFTRRGGGRWACSVHCQTGTCENNRTIVGVELSERVLTGLKDKLLSPEAYKSLLKRYHIERQQELRRTSEDRGRLEQQLGKVTHAIKRLVSAITEGDDDIPELRAALREKKAQRVVLEGQLGEVEALPTIVLHPQILEAYKARIEGLTAAALKEGPETEAIKAQVRALIDRVIVTPRAARGQVDIELVGSLQAILGLAEGGSPRPSSNFSRRRPGLSPDLVAEDRYQFDRQFRSTKV